MGAAKSLNEAKVVFLALLVIGLIGLLFLIIYGNLSGNLGFTSEGVTVVNETGGHANTTGYTLTGASNIGAGSFVITAVFGDGNQTNGTQTGIQNNPSGYSTLIPATNYTVTSGTGILTNSSTVFQYPNVSVSYAYNRDSVGKRNTDVVITNLTSGAVSFFSFSNVWFILLAVTVLIGIVIGVIALVERIGGRDAGGKGRSEFMS